MIGRWFWRLIAWSTDAVNQAKLDQELLKAIQYNKLGLVNRLHAEGASVNCRNEKSRSPLHLSVYSDWDRISHFLIDMGADLNAKGKFGGTPLHLNFGKQANAKAKPGTGLMDKFGGWFSSSEDKPSASSPAEQPEPESEPEPSAGEPEASTEEVLPEHEGVEMEEKLVPETVARSAARASIWTRKNRNTVSIFVPTATAKSITSTTPIDRTAAVR